MTKEENFKHIIGSSSLVQAAKLVEVAIRDSAGQPEVEDLGDDPGLTLQIKTQSMDMTGGRGGFFSLEAEYLVTDKGGAPEITAIVEIDLFQKED